MSINHKLTTFAQQELVIFQNEIEKEKINASLTQLGEVLKNKPGNDIKNIIPFGSFTRNTVLPQKYHSRSDVDLMVVFNSDMGRKTPATQRSILLDILSTAYPNSDFTKDLPAVKLELNHIKFDIVPAYDEEAQVPETYYIPAASDTWQTTIPNVIRARLRSKNQEVGNNIVRNTIRLCKCWNAGAGYPFESYLMEGKVLKEVFWLGGDLYEKFLKAIETIAGHRPQVSQALEYIQQYKADMWTVPDEAKQFEWLQKLLPGLK